MSRSRVTEAGPAEGLLEGFVGYLRSERGVTMLTVEVYVSDVRRFLAQRGDSDLRGLTAAEVSNAVLGQIGERASATVRLFGCALRSFLRYSYLVGLVDQDLSAAALPVSGRRRSLLPQGITPIEARLLLGACDRRRATGRRDYAVIVLMLRLGLRATEVATLRLEDLDWRAGQLTVHGKGGRVDQLPLPVDVGEAIAAYLRRGRPREATVREVFLRVSPPQVAMARGGVTAIVARRRVAPGWAWCGRTGCGTPRPVTSLRAGAPLAEIGQVLRHRSLGSTAAYARVDVERLRTIAQPWPTGEAS
ncbi:MAG: tyrosine-type recombinase/integrase [Actinobacteria bacterium]|nr:tyrosine-type recombinase/integrase [Actinomycetota bacterium]